MTRTGGRPRVLVIYKKTALESVTGREKSRVDELLAAGDASVASMQASHDDHLETIEAARAALKALGAKAVFRHRHSGDVDAAQVDLVVTLGGDGTLLWASHLVGANTPTVAINSAPRSSVGYFCAGDKDATAEILGRALACELKVSRLSRMRVDLGGETISTRVLNDILFCHSSPAMTSRYLIQHRGRSEDQRSSGVWAGPAAGSTAAQRSAGGRVLPITSRKLQFVVREIYRAPGAAAAQLSKGLIGASEELHIQSKMHDACIFVDGAHRVHHVDLGAKITLCRSGEPLSLLGLRPRRRADDV